MKTSLNKLENVLLLFSGEDLLRSFFVLNLWLPNIASPIRVEYLYTILESLHKDLLPNNQITNYHDFKILCERVFKYLPFFQDLEDYVPETDWGNIIYYFKSKFYKVFYGTNLCNSYDFYYAFEVIHCSLEKFYSQILNRSVSQEFEFCLDIQDHLIRKINQKNTQFSRIQLGDLKIPPEKFWEKSNLFLTQFRPEEFYCQNLISEYSYDFDLLENLPWLGIGTFLSLAQQGKNCPYYFIKKNGKYFPVMPRKYLSILFNKWGKLLNESELSAEKLKSYPNFDIGIGFFKFVRDRVKEENVFNFVSPVNPDSKPCNTIFEVAIYSKKKLFLIHIVSPYVANKKLDDYLARFNEELVEAKKLLSLVPMRLKLNFEKQIVEIYPEENHNKLMPVFLVVIPYSLTSEIIIKKLPRDFLGKIMSLEQLAGILDETKDVEEFAEYFDFLDDFNSVQTSPLISYLDKYAEFVNSHGVLFAGAVTPNSLYIDNMGSNFRYWSLLRFWRDFPENKYIGHPRSWLLTNTDRKLRNCVLESRSKDFRIIFCRHIGKAMLFLTSPFYEMTEKQRLITMFVVENIYDMLAIYRQEVEKLDFSESKNSIHISIFPESFVNQNIDGSRRLGHLSPDEELCKGDITRLGSVNYGIRFVFNDPLVYSLSLNVTNRSLQLDLLLGILKITHSIWNNENWYEVEQILIKERSQTGRFKLFEINIPILNISNPIFPKEKDFKMADKIIAQFAKQLNIIPGKYSLTDAKIMLKKLIPKLINEINTRVSKFNYRNSIVFLLEKIEALIQDYKNENKKIEVSLNLEVDYEREAEANRIRNELISHHKCFRYLIEKFVLLQPCGQQELKVEDVGSLLALVMRILDLYSVNDIIYYNIYRVGVIVDSNYLISINQDNDISEIDEEYNKEQCKIHFGIIGKQSDGLSFQSSLDDYIEKLEGAFRSDLGFGFKNFVYTQMVMCESLQHNQNTLANFDYSTTFEDITKACNDISSKEEIGKIITFLTLSPDEMLKIADQNDLVDDLPVWEYYKRVMRYNIRPLILVGERYYCEPYSIEATCKLWCSVIDEGRLPVDIYAPNIKKVLGQRHKEMENDLPLEIEKIIRRHTNNVRINVNASDKNIGDYDVLAYLEKRNILLNIEAKIINPAYCFKDSKRVREKLYGRSRKNGSLESGYVQKVERREDFLRKNYSVIMDKLRWLVPEGPPNVISIFTTQTTLWWMKYPPFETKVKFMEVKLLDDYITELLAC